MSHRYHGDLRGIVLRDGCDECEGRAATLIGIDDGNLRLLGVLAQKSAPEMGFADHKAVDTLRLFGRIVFRSEITEEVAR